MAFISRFIRHRPIQSLATRLFHNINVNNVAKPKLIPPALLTNFTFLKPHIKIEPPPASRLEIQLPNGMLWIPPLEEPTEVTPIELPTSVNGETPKQAARLIVIRRKKMKKHKLKKLRKRMKYEWAKRRQRRELKKEKAFQAVLIKQYKEAEAFSAEQYVSEKIAQYNKLVFLTTQQDQKEKKHIHSEQYKKV